MKFTKSSFTPFHFILIDQHDGPIPVNSRKDEVKACKVLRDAGIPSTTVWSAAEDDMLGFAPEYVDTGITLYADSRYNRITR